MSFSERMGIVPQKEIQIDSMDTSLRNRLRNFFDAIIEKDRGDEIIPIVLDRIGQKVDHQRYKNVDKIRNLMSSKAWNTIYDILEYSMQIIIEVPYLHTTCNAESLINHLNYILTEEKSGYRFLGKEFVKITNESELESVQRSTHSDFDSVNTHMKKALSLYSNRKNPDYENSIKESISAVEAMCCIITGMKGSNATLGAAIKKLEDNGVVIHGAMKSAFSQLYGYTSDQDGIRHGGIDFKNAPEEDALYMLISCSAFVNYLIEKYSKIQNGGT